MRDAIRKAVILSVVLTVVLSAATIQTSYAAPDADLWPRWQRHDPSNNETIDHAAWDQFLKRYVVTSHPSGINRVRYGAVSEEDRASLRDYLDRLQNIPISNYNRTEQKAYWIDLYNALTVALVLSHYPVDSILDIDISPGWFTRGPWGAKLLTIEGQKVSLDDIEHRILRPIWKDNRVHYAVNCASLGCPNLRPTAFTSENTDMLLERGSREYVNHPRAVSFKNGKARVSSIYIWFHEDFGGSSDGVLDHLRRYADCDLVKALKSYRGKLDHDYDWRLNASGSWRTS